MKIVSLLLSLCLASVALAEEPAELVKLRTTYDNSLRGEFQKVRKLYHGRLVELKKNYMEAQHLDAAVAVDAEIKKLVELHEKQKFEAPEPQEKASPSDGVWVENSNGSLYLRTIHGNRMANYWKGRKLMSECTLKNGVLEIKQDDGWWWKLNIDPDDPDTMEGKRKDGKKATFTRIKW